MEPGFAARLPCELTLDCEAGAREEMLDSAVAEEEADWANVTVPAARDAIARMRSSEFIGPS
jgi:hypothetical protein